MKLETSATYPTSKKRSIQEFETEPAKKVKPSDYLSEIVDRLNKIYKPLGLKGPWDKESFEILQKDDAWLNDVIINSLMMLVKKNFPEISGLNNTLDYQTVGYPSALSGTKFLQIMHTGSAHWVVVFGEKTSQDWELKLYDSMIKFKSGSQSNVQVSRDVEWQISQLLRPLGNDGGENHITVKVMACQQQLDSSSCGLFAIANLLALVYGLDPSVTVYEDGMRKQLLQSLEQENLKPFKWHL